MDLASRVKAQTVNSYLFKISPVIHFGKEKGYITEEIQFSHMVYQEHFKDIYTEDEIKKLLVRPKIEKFNEYRTWVIISVFLGTGIRSLELRSIRCKDVNMTDGYINLIHTKSKEPRIVPLSDTLILGRPQLTTDNIPSKRVLRSRCQTKPISFSDIRITEADNDKL